MRLHNSPTRAMEVLGHQHCYVLVEVKGTAVWILNILVDASRHHGETGWCTKIAAWWTSIQGKGRAWQRMAIR